jgi:hypothetical protein
LHTKQKTADKPPAAGNLHRRQHHRLTDRHYLSFATNANHRHRSDKGTAINASVLARW